MPNVVNAADSGEPTLSEEYVQGCFHSYLKSSLAHAKVEGLLDPDTLSSAEADLMITGPALCLYFAALRSTTNPPSVPLPRHVKNGADLPPADLSLSNCPPTFRPFLLVWSELVPQIQALTPEHQHDLARVICGLQPLATPLNRRLNGLAADMRAVAIEISMRRTFQEKYADDLQAALDSGPGPGDRRLKASFMPPPSYDENGAGPGRTSRPISTGSLEPRSPTRSSRHTHTHSRTSSRTSVSSMATTPSSPSPLPPSADGEGPPQPTILAEERPGLEFVRETLYAALADVLERRPELRALLGVDGPRAYFAAVAFAILDVAASSATRPDAARKTLAEVLPGGAGAGAGRGIRGVLGQTLALEECPGALRPFMEELCAIGAAAHAMEEEDSAAAVRALQRGEEPAVPRLERVRDIIGGGVGHAFADGGVGEAGSGGGGDPRRRRTSTEGRAVAFANRVNALALGMTRLRAFRERQEMVFNVLAGVGGFDVTASSMPADSRSRRYPCPCRDCRMASGPDSMQLRPTIKRHVKAEVAGDLASGLILTDEQYTKMRALLRGANLPEDLYSAAYTHLVQARQAGEAALPEVGQVLVKTSASACLESPEAAPLDDDSGFFEGTEYLDTSGARHSAGSAAGDDSLLEGLLGSPHPEDDPDLYYDALMGPGEDAASPDALWEAGDDFRDTPEGLDDYPHDLYCDDAPHSVHGSPEPRLMADEPAHHILGNLGDYIPLVLGDLELDEPVQDLFSDWSSDPGLDEDVLELRAPQDAGAPLLAREELEAPDAEMQEVLVDNVLEILEHDPDFVHADNLFDPDAPFEELPTPGDLPAAFDEDPLIRRAYVQAFIAHAFHGATHSTIEHMLKSAKGNLASLSERLGYELPGLGNMAVTLRTMERRLGVDPNQYITYFFLCNMCWKRHHSSELYELPDPCCPEPGCNGILYSTKTHAGGKHHRTPTKLFPTSSLEYNIQRMLMRPGKMLEFNTWRQGEDNKAGIKLPVNEEDWTGAEDPDFQLFDIYDGWGWNAIQAGLQRCRGGKWEVEDVDVEELCQWFVALPLGLVLMINIDWFRGLKRGKYSVGAIYATICNNPRSKRFLCEETILLAVIPGPEEPSLERLNTILEPFIAEALHMYRGGFLPVLSKFII
ncbi:hypothetical protein BD413DRAFT_495917 [Trametes elegans]|nr:hypothetical protein BD413DRAFT_495917 [Trametes elegans]